MINSNNKLKAYKHLIPLSIIAILSFTLNFFAISKIGFGNAYYAAAIKSMSQNFHNFFFVSFDPAGIVSVDKPPLALWIQTIFVLLLGYHGWAMLLPQALAGTGSCIMLYFLTTRQFGHKAGLISSLVMAFTPAVVVASRNNTMDMQLILCLLIATWFLFKTLEHGKKYHLFLSALFIGLGFNIKMMQAYMILPAVAIVYLAFAKEKPAKRLLNSIISLLIVVIVSFAWVITVDLTPTSERPYVGSSTDNTETELIIGHNGMERLLGSISSITKRNTNSNLMNLFNPNGTIGGTNHVPAQGNIGNGNETSGIVGNNTGYSGIFRLWGHSLFGQISWLIILSLCCIVARLSNFSYKKRTMKQAIFIYWAIWLVTMYLFFSFAEFWHRYYLCMLAPGIAGLVGPGIVEMYRYAKNAHHVKRFLLPISLIVTFIPEILFVWTYKELRNLLAPIMITAFCIALVLMIFHYIKKRIFLLKSATVLMLISLLIGPFYWCGTVILYPSQNSTMPYAGPELANKVQIKGMTSNQENLTTGDEKTIALEEYLVSHYKKGSYLVVSQRADDVAEFIVDTGLPAVAYGGFGGVDNAITFEKLKQLVDEGKITYFIVTKQMLGFGNSKLINYVRENATLINPLEYGGDSNILDFSNIQNNNNNISLYLFTSIPYVTLSSQ